ncbi:MAG TPA: hypothetical protein ENG03_03140 [Thioploca sp.]|nr:MAG: hypothetical protein DRR19_30860 [Gammaproteobacteria bacterium]HDN26089.1 hypothetical protein [Thioploca sp.]
MRALRTRFDLRTLLGFGSLSGGTVWLLVQAENTAKLNQIKNEAMRRLRVRVEPFIWFSPDFVLSRFKFLRAKT